MRILGLTLAFAVLSASLMVGCSKAKEDADAGQGEPVAKGMDTKAAMQKANATKGAPAPPAKTG